MGREKSDRDYYYYEPLKVSLKNGFFLSIQEYNAGTLNLEIEKESKYYKPTEFNTTPKCLDWIGEHIGFQDFQFIVEEAILNEI